MERLTIKTEKGTALKMASTYPSEDAARKDLMQRYRIAVDHLAAYEDTGLEPEEVVQTKLALMGKVLAEIKEFEGVPVSRMIELALAEKNGRLVVLTPNDPLTLEQLREMDGEPVWIVEHPDWGHWELSTDAEDYVKDRREEFYGMKHDDPDGKFGLHLLGWLAYRRKPEEGTL